MDVKKSKKLRALDLEGQSRFLMNELLDLNLPVKEIKAKKVKDGKVVETFVVKPLSQVTILDSLEYAIQDLNSERKVVQSIAKNNIYNLYLLLKMGYSVNEKLQPLLDILYPLPKE